MEKIKTLTIGNSTFDIHDDEAVRFVAQELTEEQKEQVRINIGINDLDKFSSNKADTIQSTSGENITINNGAFAPIQGLKLFGKTTQDGTPTPDAPVPLVSAGDGGSLGVTVAGKNLLDLRRFVSTEDISATIEGDSVTLASKVYDWYKGYYLAITLEPNAKYTVSAYASSNGKSPFRFIAVKINGVNVGQNHNLQSDGVLSVTFTTDSSGEVNLVFGTNYEAGQQEVTYSNIQLEYGATVTEYEPYKPVQTLTLSTPNGLPGIQVTSGGNYTDENGQQWVCDEVDFGRGVYVQRVFTNVLSDASGWVLSGAASGAKRFGYTAYSSVIKGSSTQGAKANILCSSFPITSAEGTWNKIEGICADTGGIVYVYYGDIEQTLQGWGNYLASNPVTFMAVLATPIETALSAEQLAQYTNAALHTNYPNTTILNDGGAGMEVQYCTPLTSVPMVHGEADSGKILAIDEHGCVTKIDSKQLDFHMELLWENASPDSGFAAQTVSLDLTDFDFIAIDFVTASFHKIELFEKKNQFCFVNMISPGSTNSNGYTISASMRTFTISDTGIEFDRCIRSTETSNYIETNDRIIPIRIYGIK